MRSFARAMSTLKGIWKVSSSLRRGVTASVPRRLKFEVQDAVGSSVEAGVVQVPFAEHCGGRWEVREASPGSDADDTSGAMHAQFVVECAAHSDVAASTLRFDGLYDGERIAGTVVDSGGAEVADFLCTRLYTFWGAPKVKAAAADSDS